MILLIKRDDLGKWMKEEKRNAGFGVFLGAGMSEFLCLWFGDGF